MSFTFTIPCDVTKKAEAFQVINKLYKKNISFTGIVAGDKMLGCSPRSCDLHLVKTELKKIGFLS